MAGERSDLAALRRVLTGIRGLDEVLRGGLVLGDLYLVAGAPGTGKTTLGNQLAYCHAARGGVAVVATLLAESHDRMIARLQRFDFFDRSVVGERVHYVSLLETLETAGLDRLLAEARKFVRQRPDPPAIPMVLMSAGVSAARIDRGVTFLPKPFDLDRLLALIARLLGRRNGNG